MISVFTLSRLLEGILGGAVIRAWSSMPRRWWSKSILTTLYALTFVNAERWRRSINTWPSWLKWTGVEDVCLWTADNGRSSPEYVWSKMHSYLNIFVCSKISECKTHLFNTYRPQLAWAMSPIHWPHNIILTEAAQLLIHFLPKCIQQHAGSLLPKNETYIVHLNPLHAILTFVNKNTSRKASQTTWHDGKLNPTRTRGS